MFKNICCWVCIFFQWKIKFFSEFSPLQLLMGNRICILYSCDIVNFMTVLIKIYEEWWHFGFLSFRWKKKTCLAHSHYNNGSICGCPQSSHVGKTWFSHHSQMDHILWQLSDTPFKITYHWPWQGREEKLWIVGSRLTRNYLTWFYWARDIPHKSVLLPTNNPKYLKQGVNKTVLWFHQNILGCVVSREKKPENWALSQVSLEPKKAYPRFLSVITFQWIWNTLILEGERICVPNASKFTRWW